MMLDSSAFFDIVTTLDITFARENLYLKGLWAMIYSWIDQVINQIINLSGVINWRQNGVTTIMCAGQDPN